MNKIIANIAYRGKPLTGECEFTEYQFRKNTAKYPYPDDLNCIFVMDDLNEDFCRVIVRQRAVDYE